jgi:hypothetical protein
MPGHFTTLWKSRSIYTPSGLVAWEAAEYIYTPRGRKVLTDMITAASSRTDPPRSFCFLSKFQPLSVDIKCWYTYDLMLIHQVSHDVTASLQTISITKIIMPIFLWRHEFKSAGNRHSDTIFWTPVQLWDNICLFHSHIKKQQLAPKTFPAILY